MNYQEKGRKKKFGILFGDVDEVPHVPEVPGFMFQMYPMFQKYLLPYEINKFYL